MKKPASHDDYLAGLNERDRTSLQHLRETIQAAAPKAEECISYGLPAFRNEGKLLVAYGAAKAHCSLYPMSPATLAKFAEGLKNFSQSKGTIRFTPEKPIPAAIVRKLVKARIAENKSLTKTAAA